MPECGHLAGRSVARSCGMGELAWTDLRHAPVGPIVWVGRHRSAAPVAIPGHRLEVWQACVVVSGRLQVAIDGEPRLVPGGGWLLLPPGSNLGPARLPCRGLFYWIGIDPAATPTLTRMARNDLRRTLRALAGSVRQGAEAVRKQADAVLAAKDDLSWGGLATGLALISTLQQSISSGDAGIQPAMTAMRADPLRDWSVAQLAALCGLRTSRFHARFRSEIGRTPHAALVELRLLAAAGRLAQGESLTAVLKSAGFASRRGFERAFRLHYGVAPGNWCGATGNGVPVAFGRKVLR
ncbi:MAG TPA: hypothetical protein DCS97_10275 [Planctomycetes bacterium]|nr:hypothetical protein [Planctomycetota bacterium]